MSDSEIDALYASLPIPSGSCCIRVLRVLPPSANETASDPIRCELTVADLEQTPPPPYAALSYVWGTTSSVPERVICNDVALCVTTNCYAAIRDLGARLDTMPVWIDALCINQRSTEDKQQQIRLMRRIYEQASITFIWLDGNRAAVEKVFAFLSRAGFLGCYYKGTFYTENLKLKIWAVCSALLRFFLLKWSFRGTSPYLYKAGAKPQSLHNRIRSSQGPSVEEVEEVLDQVWIRRIWTFQEAVLASNPVIICGRQSLTWNRFALSLVFLEAFETYPCLQAWLDLVYSRAHFQVNNQVKELTIAKLKKYRDFCNLLSRLYHGCWLWVHMANGLCLFVSAYLLGQILKALKGGPRSSVHAYFEHSKLTYWAMGLIPALLLLIYTPISYFLTVSLIWDPVNRNIRTGSVNIIDRIIETVRTRNATNPQDISYGFYSAMERFSKRGIPLPRVNYDTPLSDVYAQLTRFMIENFNTLTPLALAAQSMGPSWVPNYTQDFGYCYLLNIYPRKMLDRASTNNWRFSGDQAGLLVVRGRALGVVREMRRFRCTRNPYEHTEEASHRINLDLMALWHEIHGPGISFEKDMRKIFITDTALSGAPYVAPRSLEAYMALLSAYQPGGRYNLFSALIEESRINPAWWLVVRSPIQQVFVPWRSILQTHVTITNFLASSGLGLLSTQSGIAVATAIGDTRSGDKLFVVDDLVVPLVLRKTGQNCRIVARANMPYTKDGWERMIRIE